MILEGEMWLKGLALVDTLCHGEVAEWLNAAVSKTVTSVIPASGVRIPPSPRFLACQPVSTLRPPLVSTSVSRQAEPAAPKNVTLFVPTPYPPAGAYISILS
jgi:hypothetical protein